MKNGNFSEPSKIGIFAGIGKMVISEFGPKFEENFRKINHAGIKEHIKKQIAKILQDPEIGKPMRNIRKGTREVHVVPFRLSYLYLKEENKIIFLDLYHKDEQ